MTGRWIAVGATVLAAVAAAALVLAWNGQQRIKSLEAELVKRQDDSAGLATEARTLARQADVVLDYGQVTEACPLGLAPDHQHHRHAGPGRRSRHGYFQLL